METIMTLVKQLILILICISVANTISAQKKPFIPTKAVITDYGNNKYRGNLYYASDSIIILSNDTTGELSSFKSSAVKHLKVGGPKKFIEHLVTFAAAFGVVGGLTSFFMYLERDKESYFDIAFVLPLIPTSILIELSPLFALGTSRNYANFGYKPAQENKSKLAKVQQFAIEKELKNLVLPAITNEIIDTVHISMENTEKNEKITSVNATENLQLASKIKNKKTKVVFCIDYGINLNSNEKEIDDFFTLFGLKPMDFSFDKYQNERFGMNLNYNITKSWSIGIAVRRSNIYYNSYYMGYGNEISSGMFDGNFGHYDIYGTYSFFERPIFSSWKFNFYLSSGVSFTKANAKLIISQSNYETSLNDESSTSIRNNTVGVVSSAGIHTFPVQNASINLGVRFNTYSATKFNAIKLNDIGVLQPIEVENPKFNLYNLQIVIGTNFYF